MMKIIIEINGEDATGKIEGKAMTPEEITKANAVLEPISSEVDFEQQEE